MMQATLAVDTLTKLTAVLSVDCVSPFSEAFLATVVRWNRRVWNPHCGSSSVADLSKVSFFTLRKEVSEAESGVPCQCLYPEVKKGDTLVTECGVVLRSRQTPS